MPAQAAKGEDAADAASPSSSIQRSELEEQIAAEIDVLKDSDLPQLRLRWRKLYDDIDLFRLDVIQQALESRPLERSPENPPSS